jgi:KDO2-lipid IV(A) lauroyltransferase
MDGLKLRRIAEYLAFRVVVAVVYVMPVWIQRGIATTAAILMCRILPRRLTRYDVAVDNLRQAYGAALTDADIDQIIFRMWEHFVRLVFEMVQFRRFVSCEAVHEIVEFRNLPMALRALCSGRPVMLVSGHFGNWEAAIATFGTFGFPMGIVARALDNTYLDKWFRTFRESTGHCVIDKKGGGPEMVERLAASRHLALLGDQDAGKRGLFVSFFGRPASTFKSIALLALQHDALILVGCATRLPDRPSHKWVKFELNCEEVIDPREMLSSDPILEITQRYSSALERAIRRCPEQYFWVHRRWKHSPDEAREERRLKKAS